MRITWLQVFADVPADDAGRDVAFWSAVSGGAAGPAVGDDGEFVPLRAEGEDPYLLVQRVGRPPGRGGWHLDLETDDRAAAVARAVAAGARVVRPGNATAMVSPAGHAFCLLGPEGHARLPDAPTWPGGHRSRVDQICLDSPAPDHEREVAFWAGFTGWTRAASGAPEFERLVRPEHLPLRMLLQRLGDHDTGGPRAHADLAASDVAAERRRHESLGAAPVDLAEHWTTMRDPAGLTYCITTRDPAES